MKVCTKCAVSKSESEFGRFKYGRDGLKPRCKVCNRADARKWGSEHPQTVRDRSAKWQRENRVRYNAYLCERRVVDPNARIRHNLRTRLGNVLASKTRSGSAVRDLGCSVSELKLHLEKQFKPGMSWDNYGEWHIDHIKALANFDLTDREQFLKACHYTNLQPLWAKENLKKGAR